MTGRRPRVFRCKYIERVSENRRRLARVMCPLAPILGRRSCTSEFRGASRGSQDCAVRFPVREDSRRDAPLPCGVWSVPLPRMLHVEQRGRLHESGPRQFLHQHVVLCSSCCCRHTFAPVSGAVPRGHPGMQRTGARGRWRGGQPPCRCCCPLVNSTWRSPSPQLRRQASRLSQHAYHGSMLARDLAVCRPAPTPGSIGEDERGPSS